VNKWYTDSNVGKQKASVIYDYFVFRE